MGICGSKEKKDDPASPNGIQKMQDSKNSPRKYQDNSAPTQSNKAGDKLSNRSIIPDEDPNKQRNVKKKDVFKGAMEKDEEMNVVYEKFKKIESKLNMDESTILIDSLINHFFFSSMEPEELEKVMGEFFLCEVGANEYIFKQGDQASCFFIIYSGTTSVEINGVERKRLGPKDNFGELALLYNAPRSASIKSLTACRMFAINRSTFKAIQMELSAKKFKENRNFLEKIPFFEYTRF